MVVFSLQKEKVRKKETRESTRAEEGTNMSGLETDVGGELDLPKQGNGHGSSFNPPLQKKKKSSSFGRVLTYLC